MRLPNFVVIGAPRSGTTTLHYTLGQHPEVFMSRTKETNFFLFDGGGGPPSGISRQVFELLESSSARTLPEYGALFAEATERHRAVGESSPSYLICPEVAPRIKARLPEARLVAILRQPVDQALSLYSVRQGGNLASDGLAEGLVSALEAPAGDAEGGLPLAEHGRYHRHLRAFFDTFERARIKVTLLEDLERDPDAYFADLFEFLGVDADFRPQMSYAYNQTGIARSATLHRMLHGSHQFKQRLRSALPRGVSYQLARLQHGLRSANLRRKQDLPPPLRRELTERFYGADMAALEELLGRDLNVWRA